MSKWLDLLLVLFCLVCHSGNPFVGNTVLSKKGDNVILLCEMMDNAIWKIELWHKRDEIFVCENGQCKSENGRLVKEGSCDVNIKDLIFSDAGKYFLKVYNNTQTTETPQIRMYYLHIHDEISVKTGEQLKLDVLMSNADKVETNSSGEWTEVWTRGHGVSSDRLTDRDGNLTINVFRANDTGTYKVLDSEGEILITVTVTESSPESGSKGGQRDTEKDTKQHNPNLNDTDDHGTDDTKHQNWILPVSVAAVVVAVVAVVVALIVCKFCPRKNRNMECRNYTAVQLKAIEQRAQDVTNDATG